MKKKQYEKPSVEVVVLKQEPLMQASVPEGEKSGYGPQNDLGTWEEPGD